MKCFEHPTVDAIGVCTACGKGRCRECLVDMQRAVACRGTCEIETRRLMDMRDYMFAAPSIAASRMKWVANTQRRGGLFGLLMGGIIITFGVMNPGAREVIWLGSLFVVFGAYGIFRASHRADTKQFRLCPHCGYNITGNTTGKCSECGKFY